MRNSMLKENVSSDKGEYIQLEQEYYGRDFAGRHTTIDSGSYGILIKAEEEIETIFDLSPPQKERCLDLFRSAKEKNHCFALVAGYPCVLGEKQFIRKKPISSIVPWEIL